LEVLVSQPYRRGWGPLSSGFEVTATPARNQIQPEPTEGRSEKICSCLTDVDLESAMDWSTGLGTSPIRA